MKFPQFICVLAWLFRWRVGVAMSAEDIAEKSASQKRSVGENEMPHTRMRNHPSQWIRTACIMPSEATAHGVTQLSWWYTIHFSIQIAEISASGLGGDTESEYLKSSC